MIGLRPGPLPDEYQPGLNVRFMGINGQAIMPYLVSAYYSSAFLAPDAHGVRGRPGSDWPGRSRRLGSVM